MQPGDSASAEAGGEADGWGDFGAFEDGAAIEGTEAPQQESGGTPGGVDAGMIDDAFGDVAWGEAAGTASDPTVDDGDFSFGDFPEEGDAPLAALPISGMALEGASETAAETEAALQDGATPPGGEDDFGFGGFGEQSAGSAASGLLLSASEEVATHSAAALPGGLAASWQGGALPAAGGIGEDESDFGGFQEDPSWAATQAEDLGEPGLTGGLEGSEGWGVAATKEGGLAERAEDPEEKRSLDEEGFAALPETSRVDLPLAVGGDVDEEEPAGGDGAEGTAYTLHPSPYTLAPTTYALHPNPYTLHPAPNAQHPNLSPTPQCLNPI